MAVILLLLFYPPAKIFLLKALLHTGLFNASTKTAPVIKENKSADLFFTDQNGITQHMAELRGKVIFINFWATWCPPCIAEMGSINALHAKLKHDPHFVFILANADNNLPASIAFMNKNKYDLPVYTISSAIPENLFSGTLPATLIVDAGGNIVQKHEGIANYDTAAMLAFLQSLTASPAPVH
jgi:thiol-disulfide isomerase/thioredoxin